MARRNRVNQKRLRVGVADHSPAIAARSESVTLTQFDTRLSALQLCAN